MFSIMPRRKGRNGSAMVERDPFRAMSRDFESLFDRLWGGWPFAVEEFAPAVRWGLDLRDAGKEFVVRAEAPGFEPEDFNVNVTGDVLTITAEHKEEKEEKEEGEEYKASTWGRLERSVMVPRGIDPEKVEAKYRNGVLEIHLPKTPEAVGRRVEVKA